MKLNPGKSLSIFVTAGFPTVQITVPLVLALVQAGADVIELGVPFSDPVADGPVIQMSSEVALRNGITLQSTMNMAEEIRKQSSVPLILMGYANPVYAFGIEQFFKSCQQIGVTGTIIPDIPIEESKSYIEYARKQSIDTIFLATPTTPDTRLKQLDELSRGFLYCVSITGVTGKRDNIVDEAKVFLERARKSIINNPLFVGFGISTPADAKAMAQYADGIIIGSALVRILQTAPQNLAIEEAARFVSSIRKALDN